MRKTITATLTAVLLALSATAAVANGHKALPNDNHDNSCRGLDSDTYCGD